jgi:formylmethanofuran dehydrogenase subunit E
MDDIHSLLEISARSHSHVCPRQILGVRIGLAGAGRLGLPPQPPGKRLLAILETDGCFADGVSAATGCAVGHRTLRIEDFGKIAATFVDTENGRAIRVAPVVDARRRAAAWAPDAPTHYIAQIQAYQAMPDRELLAVAEVQLATPVEEIVSRHGLRVECAACGEEIINQREVVAGNSVLCLACAGQAYYRLPVGAPAVRAAFGGGGG